MTAAPGLALQGPPNPGRSSVVGPPGPPAAVRCCSLGTGTSCLRPELAPGPLRCPEPSCWGHMPLGGRPSTLWAPPGREGSLRLGRIRCRPFRRPPELGPAPAWPWVRPMCSPLQPESARLKQTIKRKLVRRLISSLLSTSPWPPSLLPVRATAPTTAMAPSSWILPVPTLISCHLPLSPHPPPATSATSSLLGHTRQILAPGPLHHQPSLPTGML